MLNVAPTANQLAVVISHAIAPAFLLGAVAGFISILSGRLEIIVARIRVLNAINDTDTARARLKSDIPRLQRRAQLINRALKSAVFAAIFASILVIVAFICAYIGVDHVVGSGLLFVVAMSCLTFSLVTFAREIQIALHEFDHYS